jgi:hypothetical protein
MMSKGSLSFLIVAATLVLGAGCKGSDEAQKADTPPPPPAASTPAPTASAAATEVAVGGTVLTQQAIKVYQAADPASTLLTTLGPGTLVETKTRYGDWMKINWPSGVGKLSPGWCQSAYLATPRAVVADAGADSGTPAASASAPEKIPAPSQPSATPSATPTTTPSATPTTTGSVKGRPVIRIPPKRT